MSVASISGAVLGYAMGDVPGAVYGYNIGKKLTEKNMGKRQRTGKQIGKATKKMKQPSITNFYPRGKNASTQTGVRAAKAALKAVKVGGSNQTSRAVRHKVLRKTHKGKKKPIVRVSKQLRQKVLKVFDSKMVHGNGRVLILGGRTTLNGSSPLWQKVFPLPMPRATNVQSGCLFDPYFIMYCASRLWNGRLRSGGTLTTGSYANLLQESETGSTPAGWSNFSKNLATEASAFKVEVTDLKAKITMKNNSGRTMYLKMYECKPKQFRKDTAGYGQNQGFAIGDWQAALQYDGDATIKGAAAFLGQSAINVAGNTSAQSVSHDTLYATPLMCQSWKRVWNANVVEITLEPGQTHVHWVQGDVGEYDFSKMYTKAADATYEFNNLQKTDRHIFFTGVNELASVSNTASGRMLGPVTDQLLFETEIFCTMRMPETSGFVLKNVGNLAVDTNQMVPLSQRKRGYFVDTYYGLGDDAATAFNINRDDNNPILQTA